MFWMGTRATDTSDHFAKSCLVKDVKFFVETLWLVMQNLWHHFVYRIYNKM